MTYLISLVLFALAFVKRNSKILFFILIVFMIVLFGWSNHTADWDIYQNRYYNYVSASTDTEPLFNAIVGFFYNLGIDFRTFLIIISCIIMFIYCYTLKNIKNKNFILILYFIFPFIIEVSQIRFAMASVLAVTGILILCKEDCDKKDYIKFFILIILSGFIHFATLFCLLFAFAKKISINKLLVTSILIMFILIIFTLGVSKIDTLHGNLHIINKINFVIENNAIKSKTQIINSLIRIITFFIIFVLLNYVTRKKISKDKKKEIYFCDFVLKINIISLLIIPLLYYSPDLYRIQQLLSIINYISYSKYFEHDDLINNSKIIINDFIFECICIINAIINLYLLVLSNTNINTVFYALFNNNLLIK